VTSEMTVTGLDDPARFTGPHPGAVADLSAIVSTGPHAGVPCRSRAPCGFHGKEKYGECIFDSIRTLGRFAYMRNANSPLPTVPPPVQ